SIKVTTGDKFYTRHTDFEERLLEVVLLETRARPHGAESKPTSLPPVPVPAPSTEPAKPPAPPPEPKKAG
ncbi:MAG: hypothetical protein NTW87_22780, partial [Planctomycetota bacterium]|nr:hypothetical protein [Planctomycetota bacterium]